MKRKFLTLFVAFVILLAGCGTPSAGTEATPTPYPTPVKATFTVQRGDIAIDAKLTGRVSPLALQTVYFQIGGQVSEVLANVNDVVTEGQLLGELRGSARDQSQSRGNSTHHPPHPDRSRDRQVDP